MEKINNTPIRTSENYKMNHFEIDVSIFEKVIPLFNNYKCENVNLKPIKQSLLLKYGLGLKALDQVDKYSNFSYEIDVLKDKTGIIEFCLNKENTSLVDSLYINVKNNLNLIIKYVSDESDNLYHNGVVKVNLEDNAKANITIINNLNKHAINMFSIDNNINENASLNFQIVDFGGNITISNYYANLAGACSSNNLNSIYFGSENQVFDLNYIAECYGMNATINMDVQGALKDKSKKSFKGTIDFKKGCKKSIGDEKEFCTLLSKESRSKSLPILLSSEEDVIGSHSSAAGKVDEKVLFYMTSRGISKEDAEKLIVHANFNKTIDLINDKNVKEYVLNMINEKI